MNYADDLNYAVASKLPWELLKNKNILITGATGLIGSCIVEILLRLNFNFNIYLTSRNINKLQEKFKKYTTIKLIYIQQDVTEPLNSNINFDYIIDCASIASPQLYATNPVNVIMSNINGVYNLLNYGITHNLQKFIYISSNEIYGECTDKIIKEYNSGYIDPVQFRSCYPSSKRAAETLCVSFSQQYKLYTSIVRPCHIYGPGFNISDKRVYAQFIRNVLNDEDIILKSDGSQIRSWCYVVDCALAILYVLFYGKNSEAYNIADDSSILSIKELAYIVANLNNKNVIFNIPDKIEQLGYNKVKQSIIDTEKLKALGWNLLPGTIENKLEHTINYLKH